jgi:hypothetical protein
MKLLFPLSAVVLGAYAVAAAAAPCGPPHKRHCVAAAPTVDFSVVPDVSKQIVADEPAPPPPKPATAGTPAPPYTGPTLGVAPLPRAPTVGYKWLLE